MPNGTKTIWSGDTETETPKKNEALASLLQGPWDDLDITQIVRFDTADKQGWQATYNP